MTGNYYNCQAKSHGEFTCLSYSYANKRFTRDRWCSNCRERFPERSE